MLSTAAVHTITTKHWSLQECCHKFAAAGFGGICVWRNAIEAVGLPEASRIVKDSGLTVPSLVRGGFFASDDSSKRTAAIDENKRCIDEAAAIGAEMVVLVVGATVGVPLEESRKQVAEGLSLCLDHAAASGVKLAIEPLHPMYAADRSCINRMKEARLVCEQLLSPWIGIACDVYHVWWDPDLEREIKLAGRQNTLFGFHVCDWRANTRDLLNDRGVMGEGCIDITKIRNWVEEAGFHGLNEIEIFSTEKWAMDQDEYLKQIAEAYAAHV